MLDMTPRLDRLPNSADKNPLLMVQIGSKRPASQEITQTMALWDSKGCCREESLSYALRNPSCPMSQGREKAEDFACR